MTQKTLLNKTAFKLFGFTMRKNLGISLLSSVFAVIFSPFIVLNWVVELYPEDSFGTTLASATPVFTVAVILLFILLLYVDFNYLYNKSASDMFHSLPVKRIELLLSKFFGAYVSALIPLTVGYIGFMIVAFHPNVKADILYICASYLYTLLMMLFCGFFTMIFIVSAGSKFDSIVSFLCVNIGFPIIVFIAYENCEDRWFGFVSDGETWMSYSTPIWYTAARMIKVNETDEKTGLFSWLMLLIVIDITIVCAVISVFLYSKRKNEKITSSYAFNFMPAIIGVLVAIISYYFLFAILENTFVIASIAGIVGALLGSAVYNVITNRGFKKIKNSLIIAAIAIVAVISANLVIEFDAFGYETYIPKLNDISKAEVTNKNEKIFIQDKVLVTTLHNEIIQARDEDYLDENLEHIEIEYIMNSGRIVRREYDVPFNVGRAQRQEIFNTYMPKVVKSEFIESPANAYSIDFFIDKKDVYGANQSKTAILTYYEMNKFVDAYCEDLKTFKLTDNYDNNVGTTAYYVASIARDDNQPYSYTFIINEDFKNTNDYIASLHLEKRDINDLQNE